MASFACPVCNIYRRSTTRNWHQAQIDNLERCGTVVVGRYNACRMCRPECWVEPITPCVPSYLGAIDPYACAVCRIIRPHSHRFWTKSQLKSICSLRTSVTPQHNCCRVCDSGCWYSNLNEVVSLQWWCGYPRQMGLFPRGIPHDRQSNHPFICRRAQPNLQEIYYRNLAKIQVMGILFQRDLHWRHS